MLRKQLFPPDLKEATSGLAIKPMPAPAEVILPLLQHTGAPCKPKVSIGDKVKLGTLIAGSKDYLSAPIHSSVSGEVKAIEVKAHPILGQYQAIVIASDGRDGLDSAIRDRMDVVRLSTQDVRSIIRECGVVGLGGAAFPAHVKLAPPEEKRIDSFILNGAECEPYLTSDHRLMLEKSEAIIDGMKIAMQILGVTQGFVAIEENKPDAINLFKKLVDSQRIRVIPLKSFYPQGAEKQLIKTVLRREVPPAGLPFDVGVVVNNVATCFAIYEALYKNKPLYERIVTVSGRIVRHPANLQVRLGTKVKDIIEFCGGLTEPAGKVIFGGPMMGFAQRTLEAPIIKGTSGIVVFSKKEVQRGVNKATCIRCAKCLQVCPMGLNPSALAQAIEKGNFDQAQGLHVSDCVECGICSYVCPGNRNIVALVKLAKQKLKK
ncbi:MAG: electron transport complex subunit RsxC [Candidatus Omnitrophica bacterium]|nr:electron transport complex subunit RsxC [Candidatus Omnitrophota bacterium]